MKPQLSVIILTYNEEKNIEECLKSIHEIASEIFIVDSFSTDSTLEICKKYNCQIYKNEFKYHAKQLNWALENLPLKTKWVMRLDADEFLTDELKFELNSKLESFTEEISGLYLKRRVYFFNKWIRYGSYYPTWLLRIWKNGHAYCENKLMDEHMILTQGKEEFLEKDIIDKNNKSLSWWIEKHNSYATKEAINNLCEKNNLISSQKINHRKNLYFKFPLFLRAFIYFIYRYFIRFGFLDGKEGLIFHFLQGFWYRFLIDAKIYEIELKIKRENKSVKEVIKELYGVEV